MRPADSSDVSLETSIVRVQMPQAMLAPAPAPAATSQPAAAGPTFSATLAQAVDGGSRPARPDLSASQGRSRRQPGAARTPRAAGGGPRRDLDGHERAAHHRRAAAAVGPARVEPLPGRPARDLDPRAGRLRRRDDRRAADPGRGLPRRPGPGGSEPARGRRGARRPPPLTAVSASRRRRRRPPGPRAAPGAARCAPGRPRLPRGSRRAAGRSPPVPRDRRRRP